MSIVSRLIDRHVAGLDPADNHYKRIELTFEQLAQLCEEMTGLHRPPDADERLYFLGLPVDIRRFEHLLCGTCGAPVEPDEEACTYCLTHTGTMILDVEVPTA